MQHMPPASQVEGIAGAGAAPSTPRLAPPGTSIALASSMLNLPDALLEQYVANLGGDWNTSTVAEMFAVPTADLESTLQPMEAPEGTVLSPMTKARLIRAIRTLAEVAGVPALSLGAPMPGSQLPDAAATAAPALTVGPHGNCATDTAPCEEAAWGTNTQVLADLVSWR